MNAMSRSWKPGLAEDRLRLEDDRGVGEGVSRPEELDPFDDESGEGGKSLDSAEEEDEDEVDEVDLCGAPSGER
jgi:hypothetical protein